MSGRPRVCVECLTTFASEGRQVCEPCRRYLELRDAFERGWRGGWSACLDFHSLARQLDDDPGPK